MVTTADYFASDIREGDTVTDKFGRNYIAQTNAEKDQMGEWNVLTDGMKWIAYSPTDVVTVSYVEAEENVYA